MSFWLFLGLLEWYDCSWVSWLVLSCFSGLTFVYLSGTTAAGCLGLFVVSFWIYVGLLEWYGYIWVSCLCFVMSCWLYLGLLEWYGYSGVSCLVVSFWPYVDSRHLSGTIDYRQVRICECT